MKIIKKLQIFCNVICDNGMKCFDLYFNQKFCHFLRCSIIYFILMVYKNLLQKIIVDIFLLPLFFDGYANFRSKIEFCF